MKIGCQTVAFAPILPDSLYDVLKKIAAIGFVGVEVGARFIKEPAEFSKVIKEAGLEIVGLHTGMNLLDTVSFEQSQNNFEEAARLAEEVGCPRIILSGAGSEDGEVSKEDLDTQLDNLNRLGEIAKRHGTKIYYHNHAWEFLNNEKVVRNIVDGTDPDLVGLAIDLGWAEYAGSDPIKTIRRYQERIGILHIRDHIDGEFVELGNGRTDVHGIVKELQRIGYDSWLIVEMELHVPNYGGQLLPGESIAVGYGYLKALV